MTKALITEVRTIRQSDPAMEADLDPEPIEAEAEREVVTSG